MAKSSDVVKDAVSDLQTAITEIKKGDEEDLGELSNRFYEIAAQADEAGQTLERANKALEGTDQDVEKPSKGEEADEAEVDQ